ncbi:MAG: chromate transporter, partial [Sphingomicrobium sp.]
MNPLSIFLRFLRFGCLAFGGPVAQIAMIRRELVEEERWLPSARFNRLLAVYQLLPGPEAMELCVHLGRMRGGRWGGFLAGLGFILPGFLLVLGLAIAYSAIDLAHPMVAAAFLGAQIAVVAMVAIAVLKIGKHILA